MQGNNFNSQKNIPRIEGSEDRQTPVERFNIWRLGLNIDGGNIFKMFLILVLMFVFTILQTTVFGIYKPFGYTPDLMLFFVLTVAMTQKEKTGSVIALIAAIIIDAAGNSGISVLPLLYVGVAYTAGYLTANVLRDSLPIRAAFTGGALILKAIFSLITASIALSSVPVGNIFVDVVLPETGVTLLFSPLPQIITRLIIKPFKKSRSDRTL